jgi:hypothetical protein
MFFPHFVGDACSRKPHKLGEWRVRSALIAITPYLVLDSLIPICTSLKIRSFRMEYRIQIYCEDQDRIPAPLEPESVRATSPKQAAEALCGKGLVEKGHHGKLAAKVWTAGSNPPDIKLF